MSIKGFSGCSTYIDRGTDMEKNTKTVVAMALSGGVDSSVAAAMLKERFSRVVGVSHYIWPDSRCCSISTLNMARALCEKIGFSYFLVDLVSEFRKGVVDDFAEEYAKGVTPNPCIRCNERVRFSVFYDRVKEKLLSEGILEKNGDLYFATGHYARIKEFEGSYYIYKGEDTVKDQSYMLYRIPQKMLPRIIFPLGEYQKTEIKNIADKKKLPGAKARESQDACFVNGDYGDFLRRNYGDNFSLQPGVIKDMQGNVLGEHHGYIYYTIGQRKGLNLGNGPWYVGGIDSKTNTVVVGRADEIEKRVFTTASSVWFAPEWTGSLRCEVKIRYNSADVPCKITGTGEGRFLVELEKGAAITPGQSAVFYAGDRLLGGGIIQ